MKKICVLLVCLIMLIGCKKVDKTNENTKEDKKYQEIESRFVDKGYTFSYGGSLIIINDKDNNSISARIDEIEATEITFINGDLGGGVKIYKDGKSEPLYDETEYYEKYYDKYQEQLKTINISEKELFEFCTWKFNKEVKTKYNQ